MGVDVHPQTHCISNVFIAPRLSVQSPVDVLQQRPLFCGWWKFVQVRGRVKDVKHANAPSQVLASHWATDTATHTWLESGLERFGPSGCEASDSPGQSLRVRGDVGSVWSGKTVLTGHGCLLSGGEGCFPPAEIVAMHVASQTSEVWRPVSATWGPVGNNSSLGERKRWAAVGYFVLFWPLLDSPWNCKIKI